MPYCSIMSLDKWFSTVPGTPSKRKADAQVDSSPCKKFHKSLTQSSFDWYQQDDSGLWHCEPCRSAKFTNAYAKGHQVKAKTTNHTRHAKCK